MGEWQKARQICLFLRGWHEERGNAMVEWQKAWNGDTLPEGWDKVIRRGLQEREIHKLQKILKKQSVRLALSYRLIYPIIEATVFQLHPLLFLYPKEIDDLPPTG